MSEKIRENENNPENKSVGKSKIKKIIILIFCALAVILAVAAAVFFLVFKVRSFEVKGTTPYAPAKIFSATGINLGSNSILLDTQAAEETLEKELPYLCNVDISVKWPSKLIIKAETAESAYVLETGSGTFAVTDGTLKVLEIVAEAPADSITVEGRGAGSDCRVGERITLSNGKGDDVVGKALVEISSSIKESELMNISLINISDENNIYLIYDERIIIRLGDSSDILRKLALAKKALDEEDKLSPTQYGEMDVTVLKKAIFAPMDYKDMPELVKLKEGDVPAPEESEEESEEDEESEDNGEENSEDEEETTQGEDETEAENESGEDTDEEEN